MAYTATLAMRISEGDYVNAREPDVGNGPKRHSVRHNRLGRPHILRGLHLRDSHFFWGHQAKFVENRLDAISKEIRSIHVATIITPIAQIRGWAGARTIQLVREVVQ